jgi:vanillate O-demethylase monooxygenase subunit
MTYVRNAWYVAAWAHECAPEHLLGVRVLNEPIVIWRNAAGELAAFEDRCVHRLASLSLGRCEGDKLRCMYDGLLYDRAGRVVEIPGQDRIPANLRVRTYPVVERHSWIWVWMGDESAADTDLIPPAVGMDMDRAGYVFRYGRLDYAAEARLITDNLLDLSHVSFLHAESFRLSETWARERPKVTEHARSIRSERWFRSEGARGTLDAEELFDSYLCTDCYIPGVVVLTARTYPVGAADALNGRAPDLNQPIEIVSHAVTPMTDKTARYFYIFADLQHGDEPVGDMTIIDKGFPEDKAMIEAQQRNIDMTTAWRFMPTANDKGVILFNRLTEKLAREEVARPESAAHEAGAGP